MRRVLLLMRVAVAAGAAWPFLADVAAGDAYAGAWLQSKDRFLASPLESITNLEGGSIEPLLFHGVGDIRMTHDFLGFAVEHVSSYWRAAEAGLSEKYREAASAGGSLEDVAAALDAYAARKRRRRSSPDARRGRGERALSSTVAIVPFHAPESDREPSGALAYGASLGGLGASALAATVAPLVDLFGRVVVVVSTPRAAEVAKAALAAELAAERSVDYASVAIVSAARTDYASLPERVRSTLARTIAGEQNVLLPREALIGLKRALLGGGEHAREWLGDDGGEFAYVFYAESDTVLLARRPALLRTALLRAPNATILAPHRLQLFPATLANGSKPLAVGPRGTCDDAGASYPGLAPPCGDFWYNCEHGGRVARHYGLLRIADGTGLPALAGTEHGRRCAVGGAEGHGRRGRGPGRESRDTVRDAGGRARPGG